MTGVSVLDETGEDLIASGSGTIYSTTAEAVYIITNQHVIASGGPIHVSFANGEQLPAELVGADPYTDLALLKVIRRCAKKANGSWRSAIQWERKPTAA